MYILTIDKWQLLCYNNNRKREREENEMFFDDFDLMITPEELGIDYPELVEENEI